MENTGTNGELTCACSCRTGRVYVGTADGRVLQLAANAATESGRALSCVHWELRLCPESVTASVASAVFSVCGVEAQDKSTLLLVGSASGELVVLREELELRRFQLESAVQQICYDRDGAFIVGDMLGNLYGVTQYEILWMKPLPAIASEGIECFYPPVAEPTVKAIAHAKLLDVEKTRSNYFLVATGQKYLLVTHRGKDFGVIPTQTPIEILASIPDGDEDIVLAAAENG
ncbi:hypothetical protein PHMEG_00019112 [Phytophthora megakarya]|uniref:Uncharacterized protein n=1 Tax=Phytophthora megakarya TaxID=4795 RepID=A0A225VTW1_9STRA|nr:hypothetical protein PHMEG_00019112 [Phytophthora megakarya]